jgi:NADH-quinone oxidoreductase subunit G
LLGSDLLDGPAFAAGAELAESLKRVGKSPRLGYLFPGPNAFGAAVLSRKAELQEILQELESGRLRALVVVESELAAWGAAAHHALGKLELLVVLGYLPGALSEAAHIFFPTAVTYESNGIYVNRAGRAQAFAQARVPSASVEELISHEKFPRTPRLAPPASEARPGWWALEALRELSVGKPTARTLPQLRAVLKRSNELWRRLDEAVPGGPGVALDSTLLPDKAPGLGSFGHAEGALMLFRSDRTLGSEVLSRRSAAMRKMAGPPVALISPQDAERLSVNGDVTIEVSGHTLRLPAKVRATVPPGALIVPRDAEWPARVTQGTVVRAAAIEPQEVRA